MYYVIEIFLIYTKYTHDSIQNRFLVWAEIHDGESGGERLSPPYRRAGVVFTHTASYSSPAHL